MPSRWPSTLSPWRLPPPSASSCSTKTSNVASLLSSRGTACLQVMSAESSDLVASEPRPARLMHDIGMRVHAINRHGRTDQQVEWIGTPERLSELLEAA